VGKELADVGDKLVADGERVLRELLAPVLAGRDAVIAAAVDFVLCAVNRERS
jgi:hypothetical protein